MTFPEWLTRSRDRRHFHSRSPLWYHGLILIPAWKMNYYVHYKVRLRINRQFHPQIYWAYEYLSVLVLQVKHVSRAAGPFAWWRHQMETFAALLAICAGNSPVPGEFPAQRPVTRSFDVFFDLRLNIRLSKQSWGWWFEMLSRPLWRHRNGADTQLAMQ